MCAKYQFVLCELGSPKFFNSFRFTDKAVQTNPHFVGLRCSTLALSLFLREKWLSDGKLDGWKASLEQFLECVFSCVEMVGRLVSGSPLLFQCWKRKVFLSQEGVSKKKTANYPCQRFDFSRKQSHVSFIFCCVPFATFPYILRCIVTKELHHLNVEQICVGLVSSQILSAHVITTKAPPLPQKLL